MKVGVQGYTIRSFCNDEEGIAQSLKKIKDIGFSSLQVSGFGAIPAERLKAMCDENGLQIVITHTNPDRILEDTENVIKEHKIMGCNHVGIGIMPKKYRWSIDGTKAFIADYSKAADMFADNGLKFHYHNHGNEIAKYGSMTLLEIMAELTDPDKWGFIFDTYWSQFGGMCPAQMMHKLAGRIDVCHLKDLHYRAVSDDANTEYKQHFAPIGNGSIVWEEVLEACQKTGIKFAEIEQDDCYGADPFEQLKISYDYLKKLNCEF